jgi:ribonuclease P protein component
MEPMSIPREHRLRKHAEFELVYRCGRRHFSPVLTAFYLLREDLENVEGAASPSNSKAEHAYGSRVGITVGRVLGKSTVRNRIKRRMRAAVTQNLARVTRPIDVVINPKKTVLETEFQVLCAEIARAFDVIEQKAVPAAAKQIDGGERKSEKDQPALRRDKPSRLAARKT